MFAIEPKDAASDSGPYKVAKTFHVGGAGRFDYITIDPEQDDPARLREYAKTFNAGPEWQHYTGTLAASQTVQRAFDVYRGNKMEHIPATLIRPAPGAAWTRIEGFATADQLRAELPDFPQLHAAR